MAVGFSTVEFEVLTEDGYFPRPQPMHNRPHVYTATIVLSTVDDLDALDAMLSRVTEKPSYGLRSGRIVAEFGTKASLTIPVDNGEEEIWTARLLEITPTAWGLSSDNVRADTIWICIERTFP